MTKLKPEEGLAPPRLSHPQLKKLQKIIDRYKDGHHPFDVEKLRAAKALKESVEKACADLEKAVKDGEKVLDAPFDEATARAKIQQLSILNRTLALRSQDLSRQLSTAREELRETKETLKNVAILHGEALQELSVYRQKEQERKEALAAQTKMVEGQSRRIRFRKE